MSMESLQPTPEQQKAPVVERELVDIDFVLPRKLKMLHELHPYKIVYGGRGSLKSWSFARTLLVLGMKQDLRILCAREVQKSLAESVHQLLKDQIEALGMGELYEITDNAIRGIKKDTLFKFTGLSDQTAQSIKSYEGFDIVWVEEAQKVTRSSWQILLPTLFRTKNAELWVSFNPDMDSDETWERFIVKPPDGAVIVEMNYRDAIKCGWFPDEQEKLRLYDQVNYKEDYDNIWEGKPRTVVAGAIYATEVVDAIREQRYRPVPYDPRLPVHCIWDLGWNDMMTVIMVQKPVPSVLNIVNYIEDNQITYAALIQAMRELKYTWGTDWLPHDAEQHDPKSDTNARKLLTGLGRTVKIIQRSDADSRIRAARMMWPRLYIDSSKRDTPNDRPKRLLGAAHLVDRLKKYKRVIPKTTNEPAAPLHDINSHAADAFGGLAQIVDQIVNEGEIKDLTLAPFTNKNDGMGTLG